MNRNQERFAANHRMRMPVATLRRWSDEERRRTAERAGHLRRAARDGRL
jgi:deoxyribodipyrimidine photolyase-like uncharacterized protein